MGVIRFRFVCFHAILLLLISGLLPQIGSAALAGDWRAGRIIDDGLFTNANDMSVSDIQNFLNNRIPSCDTNGTQPASEYSRPDLTHAQYAATRGWPGPPYICLNNYYEVPKTTPGTNIPANNFGGSIPPGAVSAAQMIYNAAQTHNISSKALLIKLATESAGPLTSDTWPLQSQYTYAMGAHCPDSGPGGSANCDPNYSGFSIQISEAASLLRWYLDSMTQPWWQYKKPYQVNNVLWNVEPATFDDGTKDSQGNIIWKSCGGSDVYIESKATAALYTYTPYQPNQAALNNMYSAVPSSTGFDSRCAAYGNRNFWRTWSDWFGSPNGNYFSGEFRAQTSSFYINTGEKRTIYMQFKNVGSTFWKDDASVFPGYPPIHLATTNLLNRVSDFRSSTWASPSRPNLKFTKVLESDGWTLAQDQHTVNKNQIAEYQFEISIPHNYSGGVYREYFQPISEGMTNFSLGTWTYIDIYVVKSVYSAGFVSQSDYLNNISGSPAKSAFFKFKNNGNVPWYDSTSVPTGKYPVSLATTWPINRISKFNSSWPTSSRPNVQFSQVYEADGTTLASNQHVVQPGQIARFSFNMQAPAGMASGFYKEYFQPILEGAPGYKGWDMGSVAWMGVNVE